MCFPFCDLYLIYLGHRTLFFVGRQLLTLIFNRCPISGVLTLLSGLELARECTALGLSLRSNSDTENMRACHNTSLVHKRPSQRSQLEDTRVQNMMRLLKPLIGADNCIEQIGLLPPPRDFNSHRIPHWRIHQQPA